MFDIWWKHSLVTIVAVIIVFADAFLFRKHEEGR